MLFGDYVVALLGEAGEGLEVVRGEAVEVDGRGSCSPTDGRSMPVRSCWRRHLPPATPRGIDPVALGPLWVADPWSGEIAAGLGAGDTVLLIGTGLTAVDAALTLDADGFRGRILALSRRGLAPRAHGLREPPAAPQGPLQSECVALLRHVRRRSAEVGWQSAVHELRTATQGLWASASRDERRRFIRHLRPWWDVHRHKIAPAVAATVAKMEEDGRLVFAGGRILSLDPDGSVRWRPRGGGDVRLLQASRIVNCTARSSTSRAKAKRSSTRS